MMINPIAVVSVLALLVQGAAHAQDTRVEEEPTAEQNGVEQLTEADEIPELVFEEDPINVEENTEEEEGREGRFIPSEEISQDLGVSFPANI
ncbi:MAG: hypothetical protein AB8B95_04520 [Pseudohongiellaceae bacterium]